jgi:hypothetical protein
LGPSPEFRPVSDISPISDKRLVQKAFLEGLRSVRPDAQVAVVDEQLRQVCFGASSLSSVIGRGVLIVPDFNAVSCRALLDQRGIRYLISATGDHLRSTLSYFDATNNSLDFNRSHRDVFQVSARTFDAKSGSVVCEDSAFEVAHTTDVAALLVIIPFAKTTIVYESAYWEHVAWLAGARTGSCFLEPAKAEPQSSGATKETAPSPSPTHEWCSIEGAGRDNRVWLTRDDCLRFTQAGTRGFGTDPWCLVDPQSRRPLCFYTSYETCSAAKITQQYRCISRE